MFRERHGRAYDKQERHKEAAKGRVFLGIDAGSTTTKAALIDDEKNLLYSYLHRERG